MPSGRSFLRAFLERESLYRITAVFEKYFSVDRETFERDFASAGTYRLEAIAFKRIRSTCFDVLVFKMRSLGVRDVFRTGITERRVVINVLSSMEFSNL